MPDPAKVTKAKLIEIDADEKEVSGGKQTIVQFNPDTLKVSFANQIDKSSGTDQSQKNAGQFVGSGSTKLAVQLWFDVTQELGQGLPETDDVRDLTTGVAYFITPKGQPAKPPGVRFAWGTFQFNGAMESMEETLELFSDEGRPLRASVSVSITQQKIIAFTGTASKGGAGQSPQIEVQAGASVQSLSDGAAGGRDWQSVAAANGIENPRLLDAGQFLDLQATKPRIVVD
ncbi:MAG TPA: peptidoglycan-binding protein [Thermoanaerobaculia bacterium]